MISGKVTAELEAVVRLRVCGADEDEQTIEAVIDTGFDGWLTLPASLISRLGLTWRSRGRALVADGGESIFDMYEATVFWDGQPRRIVVDQVDTSPLVGMSLLAGYDLMIQVQPGGLVRISQLPLHEA